MRLNPLASLVLLPLGFAIGAMLPHWRTVTVTFQRDGPTYQVGDSASAPLPAALALHDPERLTLRVVNRDSVHHVVGVLSIEPGDSVETRPDACTPARRGRDIVLQLR